MDPGPSEGGPGSCRPRRCWSGAPTASSGSGRPRRSSSRRSRSSGRTGRDSSQPRSPTTAIIGVQIKENVNSLQGSGLALAVGVGGALWAGLGRIKAAQNAMDQVWDVPVKRQPSFPVAILRAGCSCS